MADNYRTPIVIFTAFYLPGFKGGGPVRSIENLVNALSNEFEFYIVTSDRDYGDERPYENIKTNQWVQTENAKVFYKTPNFLGFLALFRALKNQHANFYYTNSFFDPKFSLAAKILVTFLGSSKNKKFLLAPRGEFSPNALSVKKWKKQVFFWVVKLLKIHRHTVFHATCEHEKRDILNKWPSAEKQLVLASNIPNLSLQKLARSSGSAECSSRLKIIYISRILVTKNLVFALKALKQMRGEADFDIYGPIEDKTYWEQCKKIIENLPDNVVVKYHGPLPASEVGKKLSEYDLLFLPTFGENYGHVIVEAMLVGTRVLISDLTPWHQLQSVNLGWDLPLDRLDMFVEVLNSSTKIQCADRPNLSDSAVRLTDIQSDLATYKRIFRSSTENV